MTLLAGYQDARGGEDIARLRRVIALRAMVAAGMNQSEIAEAVGITQSAVSQQLGCGPVLESFHPEVLLKAATPVLRSLAAERGYERLAVFGSVARGEARQDSDIDLIVDAQAGDLLLRVCPLQATSRANPGTRRRLDHLRRSGTGVGRWHPPGRSSAVIARKLMIPWAGG